MVAAFNTKFFFAKAKYTLAELGHTRQYAGEDLDLYMKRYHDKALDCVDPVDEEILVNVPTRNERRVSSIPREPHVLFLFQVDGSGQKNQRVRSKDPKGKQDLS